MKRASLIVLVQEKHGRVFTPEQDIPTTGYTCESVHVNFDGTVTAFCSGTPITWPQEDVFRIDYMAQGAEFCPFCDQSIAQFSKA